MKRALQSQWRWLHYDCSRNLVFCRTCVTAFKTGRLRLSVGNVKIWLFFLLASTTGRMLPSLSGVTRRALRTKEQWRPLSHFHKQREMLATCFHQLTLQRNVKTDSASLPSLKAYVFLLGKVLLSAGISINVTVISCMQLLRLRAVD